MRGYCSEWCREQARRDFEIARENGLFVEVVYHYRSERKNGACPHVAAWRGCYEWDI